MPSKVEIVNITLSHLAVGKEVANLETEKSEEAAAARRVYEMAKDFCLREVYWPFATKITALALIEEEPNTEWGYSYRYPTDCLRVRRVLSGLRNDTRQSKVTYKIAQDSAGLLLFTDSENAQIEYTIRADNPQLYPADFVMALSYYLAWMMAPRLTGGDQFKLGEKALKMYDVFIKKAAANAFNEEQAEEEVESEFERERW